MEAIEYETTVDDLVEFNVLYLRSSPVGRALRTKGRIYLGLIGITFGALLAIVTGQWFYVAAGAAMGIVSALFFGPIQLQSARANARRIYSAVGNHGVIGWHRLTLDEGFLREESDSGSESTKYASVERVVETPEYVHVHVGALRAHVIARARVRAGDLPAFLKALRERMPEEAG